MEEITSKDIEFANQFRRIEWRTYPIILLLSKLENRNKVNCPFCRLVRWKGKFFLNVDRSIDRSINTSRYKHMHCCREPNLTFLDYRLSRVEPNHLRVASRMMWNQWCEIKPWVFRIKKIDNLKHYAGSA